jgi:hypothetical protein
MAALVGPPFGDDFVFDDAGAMICLKIAAG